MGKSNEIADILLLELDEGKYPAGSRFPSENALSMRFHVNRTTVNRAINTLVGAGRLLRGKRGSGTTVSSRLPVNKGRIIFAGGSILHQNDAKIFNGVLITSMEHGYVMDVIYPKEKELPAYMSRFTGNPEIIGIITMHYASYIDQYCPGVPVVYIDMPDPVYHPEHCHIASDNEDISVKLMRQILARGHREIVIYASDGYKIAHQYYRVRGFVETMKSAGIADAEHRVFGCMECNTADGVQVLQNIFSRYPETTAIVTTSDDLVRVLLAAMKILQLSYPESFIITGFGNLTDIADVNNIPGVEQNPFQLGAMAALSLIDLKENKISSIPPLQIVRCNLVNTDYITPVSRLRRGGGSR